MRLQLIILSEPIQCVAYGKEDCWYLLRCADYLVPDRIYLISLQAGIIGDARYGEEYFRDGV